MRTRGARETREAETGEDDEAAPPQRPREISRAIAALFGCPRRTTSCTRPPLTARTLQRAEKEKKREDSSCRCRAQSRASATLLHSAYKRKIHHPRPRFDLQQEKSRPPPAGRSNRRYRLHRRHPIPKRLRDLVPTCTRTRAPTRTTPTHASYPATRTPPGSHWPLVAQRRLAHARRLAQGSARTFGKPIRVPGNARPAVRFPAPPSLSLFSPPLLLFLSFS